MVLLRVFLILYRQVWPFTIATSLLMWALAGYPTLLSIDLLSFLTKFFWLRTLSQLLIWYLFRATNRKGFVFYQHFGLSELQLASGVYTLDLIFISLWICLASLLPQQ